MLAGSPAGSSLLLSHRFLGFSFLFAVPPELRDLLSGSRGGWGTCWYFDEASGAFINELRNSGSRGIHASLRNRPDVVLGVATAILARGSVAWFRGAAPWARGLSRCRSPLGSLVWVRSAGTRLGLGIRSRGADLPPSTLTQWGCCEASAVGGALRPAWAPGLGSGPHLRGRPCEGAHTGGYGRHLSHRVFHVFSSISHFSGCAFLVRLHLFLLSRPLVSYHVRC